ncbi:MAG TPA: ROK family protein [Clostridia bacterium]|nr:ROK family protein [Clostridia bacterium]
MTDFLTGLGRREIELLNTIRKNGPVTKNGLIEKTGARLTTLNRSMKLLENQKLIAETGTSVSTGGRKPIEYDVTGDSAFAIGVDISRTYTRVIAVNLKMHILKESRFDMDETITPRECADRIASILKQMTSTLSSDQAKVLGVGIGTVGPMDRNSGVLLHPQGFRNPEWNNEVLLKDLLQKKTGLPCEIDNGANTAVLAEFLSGSGRGYHCVAYIHCGVGIRTAVIQNGTILRAMNDNDDAFAHMTIDQNGPPCLCGGKGCLENYVSLASINARYAAITGNSVNDKELFRRAAGLEKEAADAFQKSAGTLGIGISNLAKLMNPDLIILSGPLIANYAPYYSICVDTFTEWNNRNSPVIFQKEGFFKENAVAIGAGLMVIERSFNQTRR